MRNNNLKRFLTTASALGMIAIGAQEASAAALNTVGAGGAVAGLGTNLTAPFVAAVAQDLAFATANTLNMNVAGAIVGGTYVTAVPGATTINNSASFGSIVTDGGGGHAMGFTMVAGQTLTLTGTAGGANVNAAARVLNTYSGLGTVDFANTTGIVNVTATGVTFANQFDSTGGAAGTLTLTGASNIFTGNIGATTTLTAINVNADTTFKSATLKATTTKIASGHVMTIDSTSGVVGAAAAAAGTIDGGANAGDGTLTATGINSITWTGAVGNTTALKQLNINTTGGTTTFSSHAKVVGGDVDASNSTSIVVISGNASALQSAAGAGGHVLSGTGAFTIAGTTTADANVTLKNTAGNTATFTGAVTTTAAKGGNFDASASVGNVTLTGGGTIDGTLTTATAATSQFATGANALTITNSGWAATGATATALTVGAGGAAFGGGLVTVVKGNVVFSTTAGAAASTYAAGMTVTAGNVTTGVGAVTFNTAGALTMTAAGSQVVVGTGGLVSTGRAITFTNGGSIDLAGNTLTLTTGASVSTKGDVISSSAGNGNIVFGNGGAGSSMAGNVGTAANAIGTITVNTGGAGNAATIGGAGSTTTVVNATATTYGAASNLVVDMAANSIAYSGTINGAGGVLTIQNGAGNTATFNGAIGNTAAITTIAATGGSVVYKDVVKATTIGVTHANVLYSSTFNKDVTGNVTFTTVTDVANILGNVTGNVVNTGNAGRGIANFGNGTNGSLNVSGTIGILGGANTVNNLNVNLNGGTLSVGGGINVANTAFTTDGTLNVSVAASALGIVTATNPNTGTVNVTAAHTLTGQVGTAASPLKAVTVANGITLTTGANSVFAPVTGGGAIIAAGAQVGTMLDVGASGANVATFTTGAGAATVGNVYSDAITTGAGTITAKSFNTKSTGTGTTLAGQVTLLDGGSIGIVTANAANTGTIATSGSATLGTIGVAGTHIAALNINGVSTNNVVTAGGNIYAAAVTQNGSTLRLAQDTTIDTGAGAYTVAAPSAIDTNGYKLIINGAGALAINNPLAITYTYTAGDANIITTAIAPTFTANVGDVSVTFAAGSSPADGTVLNVFGTSAGAPYAAMANAANTSVVFIKDTAGRGFVDGMNFVAATGQATVSAPITAAKFAGTSTDSNVQGTATSLAAGAVAGTFTGDAATLVANLKAMTAADRANATSDFATHDGNVASTTVVAQAATQAAQAAAGAVANVAGARMTTTADAQGIAAGDSGEKFGVWAQIIGGKATQKQRKGNSGFTSNMMGGTLGADTMISDNASIGMLIADVSNRAKLKDASAGDKLKANTWMFGLYGNYYIGATDFFVQGNMSVGQTSVDSKTNRLVQAGVTQTARGKYDILGVGAELSAGYKFKFDGSYVAPSVGLRYNYFGDTSYTETGLTTANQTVKTKANSVLSGLAGVRIGADIDMDGTMVKPEVHGNVSYAFNAPSSKTSFKINGAQNTFSYTGAKASKFGANFGAGVMAESEGFEYGVGYDANISDKYLAHQGSLKVKVKF